MLRNAGLYALLLCLSPLFSHAQSYASFFIGDSLRDGANAVIRNHQTNIEVTPGKGAEIMVEEMVTVLTEHGTYEAIFRFTEDRFRELKDFSGEIYDVFGKRVEKIGRKDLTEQSANDGSTFMDDSKRLFYRPVSGNTFTARYVYTFEIASLVFLPNWVPLHSFGVSLENASLTITTPPEYELAVHELVFTGTHHERQESGNRVLSWELSGIKALQNEPFSPPPEQIFPMVLISPSLFEIEGTTGDMSSWQALGNWNYRLNKDRSTIPPETAAEIKKLVNGLESREEIVQTVYEYMQQKTRYISIQLGIGGWQATPAEEVDRLCYGDCKGLTVYTMGLLEAAGVESFQCLVRAGGSASDILTDFPGMQFNHVILAVPDDQDTIWLECTSDDLTAGHLGSFTSDRHVLLLKESGSHITKTPATPDSISDLTRSTFIRIAPEENAALQLRAYFNEKGYERMISFEKKPDAAKNEYLKGVFNIPNIEIDSFEIIGKEPVELSGIIEAEGSIDRFGRKAGKRIFIPVFPYHEDLRIPLTDRERMHDIVIPLPYHTIDTLRYAFPSSYDVDYIPDDVKVFNEFGYILQTCSTSPGQILIIREFRVEKGRHDRSFLKAFLEFLTEAKRSATQNSIITLAE
jgi:hypothetical protein